MPHGAPVALPHGGVLTLGTPTAGLRTWVAVRGGIAVAPVLGSRSTDTLARVGPPLPTVGDVLPVVVAPAAFPVVEVAPQAAIPEGEVALDLVPGPRADWCDLTGLEDHHVQQVDEGEVVGVEVAALRHRTASAPGSRP